MRLVAAERLQDASDGIFEEPGLAEGRYLPYLELPLLLESKSS
jgi:hypothetical protein